MAIVATNLTDGQQTQVADSIALISAVQYTLLHHTTFFYFFPTVVHLIVLQSCCHIGRCIGYCSTVELLLLNSCTVVKVRWFWAPRLGMSATLWLDCDSNHMKTVTPIITDCYTVTLWHQSQTSAHANHSPTWHSLTESQQVGASGHRVIWDGPVMTTISWSEYLAKQRDETDEPNRGSWWQWFLGRNIW